MSYNMKYKRIVELCVVAPVAFHYPCDKSGGMRSFMTPTPAISLASECYKMQDPLLATYITAGPALPDICDWCVRSGKVRCNCILYALCVISVSVPVYSAIRLP